MRRTVNSALRLTAESVSGRALAAWALMASVETTGGDGDGEALLVGDASEDRLLHWIGRGHRILIDADLEPSCLEWMLGLNGGDRAALRICLTTSRAYAIDPFRLLNAAGLESPPPKRPSATIEIGMREALANAVIHGNLEISSELRESFEPWDRFSSLVEQRLSDPSYGRRPVALTVARSDGELRVSVHDSGPGFDAVAAKRPGDAHCCGRGVMLIRSTCANLRWDRGGRTVTMCYR